MPVPLVLAAVYELATAAVAWAAANPITAGAVVAGVTTFAEIDSADLIRRARNAVAAIINSVSPFNFQGGDFESSQRFKAALAREAAGQSGIPLRDITDRQMLREDLEDYALVLIEGRTGYRLSSLSNIEAMKGDFVRIGVGLVGEKTGIALTDVTNIEAIKADLLAWGKGEIMAQIATDLESALNVEYANGVSLMAYMKQVTGRDIKPAELLRGVQASAMGHYQEAEQRIAPITKADRRRLQNKINQRKFRERHTIGKKKRERNGGPRYIPVGWGSSLISPKGEIWDSENIARDANGAPVLYDFTKGY